MDALGTFRLSGETLAQLKELAAWSGVTPEEALAAAVERWHARFWEEVNREAAAPGSDEKVWADVEEGEAAPKDEPDAEQLWHDDGGGD
jgi:hypothetical protein